MVGVAVADRTAVPGEVAGQRAREAEIGDPQPGQHSREHGTRGGRQQPCCSALGESHQRARGCVEPRRARRVPTGARASAGSVSQLHDPPPVRIVGRAVWVAGREVQLGGLSRDGLRLERGGQRGRRVDDQHVTAFEQPRKLGEAAVLDVLACPACDEQANVIASKTPLLRGSGGLEPARQIELDQRPVSSARALASRGGIQRRAHAGLCAVSSAAR